MTTFLLALMFWGPLGLITALVLWSRARAKRQGDWRWPALGALVLAVIIAMTTAMGWLAYLSAFAEHDVASRATLVARGIAESMNFAAFSVVLVCLVTCAYYAYRFLLVKPPL